MTNPFANVVLGFLEPAPPDAFTPEQFCSKTGGTPVWLYRNPHRPPPPPICDTCSRPHAFLLQIYAPIEAQGVGHDNAFHRVLYITHCRTATCTHSNSTSQCVAVLRAQLPRRNDAYPFNAGDIASVPSVSPLCALCGFKGELVCGACRRVRYCSRICQGEDWKLGHRLTCRPVGEERNAHADKQLNDERRKWRLPEMEVVTDRHPTPPSSDDEDDDDDNHVKPRVDEQKEMHDTFVDQPEAPVSKSDKEAISNESDKIATGEESESGDIVEKGEKVSVATGGSASEQSMTTVEDVKAESVGEIQNDKDLSIKGTFQDANEDELPEDLFHGREGVVKDKTFSRFSKIVSHASDQVIRYERGGQPLWGSSNAQLSDDALSPCERCRGRRIFEVQVMPQIIFLLEQEAMASDAKPSMSIKDLARRLRDDMDWVTVVVYTCENSCVTDHEYVREFAWMQRHR